MVTWMGFNSSDMDPSKPEVQRRFVTILFLSPTKMIIYNHVCLFFAENTIAMLNRQDLPTLDNQSKAEQTEKSQSKRAVVPADPQRSNCSICGETFERDYDNITEEWVFKFVSIYQIHFSLFVFVHD